MKAADRWDQMQADELARRKALRTPQEIALWELCEEWDRARCLSRTESAKQVYRDLIDGAMKEIKQIEETRSK